MKIKYSLISILLGFVGCSLISSDWKTLDLNVFSIDIPKVWKYRKEQGEDSFVGVIKTKKSVLEFDYSTHGYANHLTPTIDEYLKSEYWLQNCPLYKVGVTYRASFNVEKEKASLMKEKGITDSTLVKVEADPYFIAKKYVHLPNSQQHFKYPKADFIADLIYKGDTTFFPIQIPAAIKNKNIKVDSTAKYITKTIWPKIAGEGLTGVYIQSRNSGLNFNLVGNNLSQAEQGLALQAFKTIKFKE